MRGGGKDRVNCGGGDDSIKLGRDGKAGKNCEHRSRSAKKGKHGKHKAKHKK